MRTQEQAILAKDRKRKYKERTRRLIQNGALAEKYPGCVDMNPIEFERVLKELVKNDSVVMLLQRKISLDTGLWVML
ncbi:MAG: hypothetical protein LBR72_08525 [Oscillospiraceae bacterium]|jgi:hypothetical protein|nr:hypothetical protein [Oscillospiraceae bacterium]